MTFGFLLWVIPDDLSPVRKSSCGGALFLSRQHGMCTRRPVLKAAARTNETLNRAGHHEQVRSPVGRIVRHDFLHRHQDPLAVDPRVPAVFGMRAVAGFDLE